MRIGIICYASVGGSGVVATELAHALATRGHEVHLISSELPFRWRPSAANLSFERVLLPAYPLFHEPQYLLGLTNTLVRVSRERRLDVLHGSLDRYLPGVPGVSAAASRRGFDRAQALGIDGSYTLIRGAVHGVALRVPGGSTVRLPRAGAWLRLISAHLQAFSTLDS